MLAPLLFQAPVFISFYFAISRMAEGLPSMRDGGFAWFQDLSIADPTFALPIISSLTFLAAVEFAPQNPAVKSSQREMTKWGLRALGVAMVPLTASFPSGVFVYWITSNVFSFAQTVLLRVPFAKRAMGDTGGSAAVQGEHVRDLRGDEDREDVRREAGDAQGEPEGARGSARIRERLGSPPRRVEFFFDPSRPVWLFSSSLARSRVRRRRRRRAARTRRKQRKE